jgi:hypothetical protein
MASVRNILQNCLGQSGRLSIRQDALGVYGNDNPQNRSLLARLDEIENRPFVRVALVTVLPTGSTAGQNANLQRDLDNANIVWRNELAGWVYPTGSRVVTTNLLGTNGLLNQNDCSTAHSVSNEEDNLFDLGRNMGADVVCYYIAGDVAGFAGCAAHPAGRRGFWVGGGASPWTFTHELGHVVGDLRHSTNSNNLMFTPTANITNLPPNLSNSQSDDVLDDPDVEEC